MIIINTREELRQAKREVKKLIKKGLTEAKAKGKKLKRGAWGTKNNAYDSVCLVGAIGLTTDVRDDLPLCVGRVAPLIKNGASKFIDDTELIILSNGFEAKSKSLLNSKPTRSMYYQDKLTNRQIRWTGEYQDWLFSEARKLGLTTTHV